MNKKTTENIRDGTRTQTTRTIQIAQTREKPKASVTNNQKKHLQFRPIGNSKWNYTNKLLTNY